MDIYVYSDESGVFDRQHNEYFVFGGLVALSYSEADEATRRYQHAEKLIKAKEGLANDDEAKACCLSNSGKSKLFREALQIPPTDSRAKQKCSFGFFEHR